MATGRKVAIVTGAASGLGRAMALGLASSGMHVVAVDRDAQALGKLQAPGGGGSIMPLPADLAQPDVFERIPAAAVKEFGRVDVLVNNAGIGQSSVRADQRRNPIRLWEVPPEEWSRFLAVNATAPIMMARAVVPHLLRAKWGRVVTVTTSLGTMVRGGYLLYGSSKAAAESAMAVLAADVEGTGVTSNVLVPGGVTNTPLVGNDAGDRAKMLQPDIMVPPLLWLVSPAADGVNARRFVAADWDNPCRPRRPPRRPGCPSPGWGSPGCRSSRRRRPMDGRVTAVSRSATHTLTKPAHGSIRLLTGLGVEGDAHQGETVKHRSRVARDPSQPNLRQVHLIHAELHDELGAAGFTVVAGQMGENITTRGVDLLGLPAGTRLRLGDTAVVEVTGLRNPCAQLNQIQPGLMAATLGRDAQGDLVRKAGVMSIVLTGGEVRPGDLDPRGATTSTAPSAGPRLRRVLGLRAR